MDDIVDDDVLPRLSLAVEGLTTSREGRKGRLEISSDDLAANEEIQPDVGIATTTLGPNQLDVYGWEFSPWKKLKGYFGR
jgi:hypothetical protein